MLQSDMWNILKLSCQWCHH